MQTLSMVSTTVTAIQQRSSEVHSLQENQQVRKTTKGQHNEDT